MKNPKTTITTMTHNNNNNNLKCCYLCNKTEATTILHNTHNNSTAYIHLCTNCILRTNPSLFCSLCLSPFSPTHHTTTHCLHCPAKAHLSCCTSPPFICPSCLDPSFTFFKTNDQDCVIDDLGSARALVCASIIAAGSMTRAAIAARVEAERRVLEAVIAKRKAVQALECFKVLFNGAEDGNSELENCGAGRGDGMSGSGGSSEKRDRGDGV